MSGQDMRKIMENLKETPKEKVKLDESLGGTPIANDIMALAAKLEAIQAQADAEDLVEAEVDEAEEKKDDDDKSLNENMDQSDDIKRKVSGWIDIQLEGRGDFDQPINLILELMSYLPEEQVAQLMDKYQVFGDEDAEGWD